MKRSNPGHSKLIKREVDAAQPARRDVYVWDGEVRGFGLRVRPSGSRVFIFDYRPAGGGRHTPKRLFTIGSYPTLTLDQARTIARGLAGDVAKGIDPGATRDANRAAVVAQREAASTTASAIATEFIERYAKPRNRRWKEYDRVLKRYVLGHWGHRPIADIRRSDVARLLDRIEDQNGAPMADHVLAVIRKMFNWYATRDDDFNSPIVIGMARTRPRERARDRILTDAEIRAIWESTRTIV